MGGDRPGDREAHTSRTTRITGRMPWLAAVAIGAVLSAVAAALAWQLESERTHVAFTLAAGDRFTAVERRVDTVLGSMQFLSGLLAHEETGPLEFGAVADPVLERLPSVRQIAWAPLQPSAGEAGNRPRFAVLYSASGTEELFSAGTDLAAQPALAALLGDAVTQRSLSAGRLPFLPDEAPLVVLIQPVYDSADVESAAMLGVLFAAQDVGMLVRQALSALVPRGIDITVHELDAQDRATLLYHYVPPQSSKPPQGALLWGGRVHTLSHTLHVGPQRWRISATDTGASSAAARAPLPWVLLTGGLLFSTLLGIYLASLARQREAFTNVLERLQQEVSERRRVQRQLALLAHHDALTGLANRALFTDRMEQALTHAARAKERVALFFIDLDGFKEINDTRGHEQGDVALKEIARRLSGAVRAEDTVARLGGDEFTVLYRDLKGPQEAKLLANKIMALFEAPVVLGGEPCRLGASIGISLYPDTARDADVLLQQADRAMYTAKRAGKGGYQFYSGEQGLRPDTTADPHQAESGSDGPPHTG